MSNPLISVIMPVYNSEEYVEEAIYSILNQSFTDFEFIIINDGSTDTSEDIVLKFLDDRIIYHKFPTNKGIVEALNFGLSIAKGQYIARMDADDISLPTRLECQLRILEKNHDVIVCGAQMLEMGTLKKITYPVNNNDIRDAFLTYNPIAHPVVMFRIYSLRSNHLKYTNDYYPAEDYHLWSQLFFNGQFYNSPEVLLLYRVHANSISQSQKEKQLYEMAKVRADLIVRAFSLVKSDWYDFVLKAMTFNLELNINNKYNTISKFNEMYHFNLQSRIWKGQQWKYLWRLYWYIMVKSSKLGYKDKVSLYFNISSRNYFNFKYGISILLGNGTFWNKK
jgi:glycosyltransferase involved in cell wall biosynthesis